MRNRNFFIFLCAVLFSSVSFAQKDSTFDTGPLERAFTKAIFKEIDADYTIGSAFSLIHFKMSKGVVQVLEYKSSNLVFHRALEKVFAGSTINLPVVLPEEQSYLAIIVYMALDGATDQLFFNNQTYESMRSLHDLKLSGNPVVLRPIVFFSPSPIR
jgi:hypothetical protein